MNAALIGSIIYNYYYKNEDDKMTDHKFTFTDAETVKAVECCNTPGSCCECPYYDINEVEYDDSCVQKLIIDILPFINRQKASLQEVITLNSKLEAENAKLQRLLDFYEKYKRKQETKTEAIKEFAERLKVKVGSIPQYHFNLLQVEDDIDILVKEMTEGKNESQSTKTVE